MAALDQVVGYLDTELRTAEVPDFDGALNGLQLGNSGQVERVATAVDFSAQTVAGAVQSGADLLIVHHGMHWNGRQQIVGHVYDRLKAAIEGDLAVYATHIPLDLHPSLGNNALLARELGLAPTGTFGRYRGIEIGVMGGDDADLATASLFERLRTFAAGFRTTAVAVGVTDGRRTRRWAIITGSGAGQETLAEARERGIDTLIVGEGPHHSAVQAMEMGIAVLYGGHYATETLGVRALGEAVARRFSIPHAFVDVPTGL
jgi:dinuclear metal center YbgI/SA1388 family protein